MNGDSQKNLDAFVRSCGSNVPQSQRPGKSTISETIYTRLRNEIAHCRKGVVPELTTEEITNNVPAFQSIVKMAILSGV